jgi:hypothetical protein
MFSRDVKKYYTIQESISDYQLKLLIYDAEEEVIVEWIK